MRQVCRALVKDECCNLTFLAISARKTATFPYFLDLSHKRNQRHSFVAGVARLKIVLEAKLGDAIALEGFRQNFS